MPDQPPRLAARKLGDIGVLLLRQHRATRRPCVVEVEEAELLARPQRHLFADAREMNPDEREVEKRLGHEVAVGHRVERVLEPRREPQLRRDCVGVERQ